MKSEEPCQETSSPIVTERLRSPRQRVDEPPRRFSADLEFEMRERSAPPGDRMTRIMRECWKRRRPAHGA